MTAGAALPYAARMDAEVSARLARYRRELGLALLGMGLLPLPCLLIRDTGWAMFAWGIWVWLLMLLPFLPYARCNRDLRAIKTARGWYTDGDDKWLWGLYYYDPKDDRYFVNARTGTNITVNLARRSGQLTMAVVALFLLALPFMGFMIQSGTGRDIRLSCEDGVLIASHGNKTYTVDNITGLELLDQLPDGLVRVMGTGASDLLKGDFRAKGISRLNVCLDPGCPPFILAESEGAYFLLGTRNAGHTVSVYEKATGGDF
ncbi:MAG: hypothetical protein IJE26_05815 [Oscillospiraceae bacterium]|nr:hypothetical protein [Oscillospiraceae bacterium]